jgi:hypothetical protein
MTVAANATAISKAGTARNVAASVAAVHRGRRAAGIRVGRFRFSIRRFGMPMQETFLHDAANGVEFEVVKTYDKSWARDVYRGMSPEAPEALATTLNLTEKYEAADILSTDAADYEDFIWKEICEGAVEDVRQSPIPSSFFVVVEANAGESQELYVSADWPSAKAFAKERLKRG